MDWILSISSTILIFIAAIFILVTIHELGHFIAAKVFGMRVDKFSIGFPPKIFGFKKGDTEYVLGATPLGGYVSIAGMLDESMETDFVDQEVQPDEFRAKPVWQRMIVITAGVIFNVILAVIIYTGIALHYGETVIPIDSMKGAYVSEQSVAHQIGMQTGDRLIGVNGEEVEHFRQLLNPSELTGRELTFLVERNGERLTLPTPPNFLDLVSKEGFISQEHYLPSSFSAVQEGSPADEAGLQGGDKIVAVDGEPVNYWVQLVDKIQATDSSLTLDVDRNGEQFSVTLSPDSETGQIGIASPDFEESFRVEQVTYNLAGAVNIGFERSNDALFGIVQGIGKMFSGDISVRENLGGPVAIANVTREATDRGGWLGFWNITAFLSITLAIMNMLPIPALDGGHFMFLVYEGITRREPSPKVRMGLQQLGFILLIGLFILVTFNDILRTFGG
ncbi:RIP metalloprotease RseP [Rhodohalobacter barkolensis]|uniref:Zinc metalloprotease n=1 Tax=Rhodohalobacter barkolensis TaxID=2053187 RepID=A0A2N0VK28_9BACT|nr:RIP metalloprotease RseP [Rhodohalobacter barkolensis]PKD44531.1 RIP metalloprotease RseP [Rhodohalobacter barkolensis]